MNVLPNVDFKLSRMCDILTDLRERSYSGVNMTKKVQLRSRSWWCTENVALRDKMNNPVGSQTVGPQSQLHQHHPPFFFSMSDIMLSQKSFGHSWLSNYRTPHFCFSSCFLYRQPEKNTVQLLSFSKLCPRASLHLEPTNAVDGRACFKTHWTF